MFVLSSAKDAQISRIFALSSRDTQRTVRRELRSFVVVLCPREFWFRSRIFGPFVIWKFKVEDLESSSENLCS